jgi:hypothetical protein
LTPGQSIAYINFTNGAGSYTIGTLAGSILSLGAATTPSGITMALAGSPLVPNQTVNAPIALLGNVTFTANNATSTMTIGGPITGNAKTISGGGSGTEILSGTITGAGSISTTAGNKLILNGVGSTTGGFNPSGGWIILNGTDNVGATNINIYGSGTPVLAGNGTVTEASGTSGLRLALSPTGPGSLSPGDPTAVNTIGTFTANVPNVTFGTSTSVSTFMVDVGAASASDRLVIGGTGANGKLVLSNIYDKLALTGLTGAWDGSTYIIATFNAYGVPASTNIFDTVTVNGGANITGAQSQISLGTSPIDYKVVYSATDIELQAIPEPATLGLLVLGGVGMLIRRKR